MYKEMYVIVGMTNNTKIISKLSKEVVTSGSKMVVNSRRIIIVRC